MQGIKGDHGDTGDPVSVMIHMECMVLDREQNNPMAVV